MARTKITTLTLLILALFAGGNALAGALEDRISSVSRLLTVSSAAKRIQSSTSPEAKAMLKWAGEQHQKAIDAHKAGDQVAAKRFLNQATSGVFAAAKRANGGKTLQVKRKRDYDDRKASIEALLKQYRAVAAEKNVKDDAEKVEAEVLILVATAESDASAKKYVEGRKRLDEAYNLVKLAIVKLRDGEVLVNALVFDTPKDEYMYYVGKIKSQRTAISVLAKRIKKPGRKKTIVRIVSRANQDQKKAQSLAKAGNYEEAIPLMESVLNKLRSGLMMVAR